MEFEERYKFSNDYVKHTRSLFFNFYSFTIQGKEKHLFFTLLNFIVDYNWQNTFNHCNRIPAIYLSIENKQMSDREINILLISNIKTADLHQKRWISYSVSHWVY